MRPHNSDYNFSRKHQPPPRDVAEKLHKVQIDKFDCSMMQWTCWQEWFELQMLANDVPEDYWVKLVGYYPDGRSYKAYELTGSQVLSWQKLVESMEDHYREKKDPNITQIELKTLQWKKGESFFDF